MQRLGTEVKPQKESTRHGRNEQIFSVAAASKSRRVADPYKDIEKQNSREKMGESVLQPLSLGFAEPAPLQGNHN